MAVPDLFVAAIASLMKKCPWCGKEYPDDVSICAIDQSPLPLCGPVVSKHSWLRYVAAVIVAFGASVATFIAFFSVDDALHLTSDSSPTLSFIVLTSSNLFPGFVGVFVGALCLRRSDRAFGAMVLLVLGIGFEVMMLGPAHGEFYFPRGAIATAIGGLLAVALYYWHRPPQERCI